MKTTESISFFLNIKHRKYAISYDVKFIFILIIDYCLMIYYIQNMR